jgi:hypothetical protein
VDPRVLLARALPTRSVGGSHAFDLERFSARVLDDEDRERVLIEYASTVIRLDVLSGTVRGGPVSLCFRVPEERGIPAQIEALRAFHALRQGQSIPTSSHARMARQLLALHAYDARTAGHSLRSISEMLWGSSDWPGDGEHQKSRVRRLVASGEALVHTGPAAILR